MDTAASAYTALTAAGTDTLLMAADHTLRRELFRRIRDDLLRPGLVDSGAEVTIAGGTTATAGDLIVCTRNDHTVEAGEPGRTLANGDLLRIDAITPDGTLLVRRALDADRETGQRRWTDHQFPYAHYEEADWATRSPTTPPRAAPSTPAWPSSPDQKTASTPTSPSPAAPTRTPPTCSPPRRSAPTPTPPPAPELARYDRLAGPTR
jgi:hypothetical protein